MDVKYIDPQQLQVSSSPYEGYFYGLRHVSNTDGQPNAGYEITPCEPVHSSFLPSKPASGIRSKTTKESYINTFIILRTFFEITGFEKIRYLVNNVGFSDLGRRFGNDRLLTYQLLNEKVQFELYINDNGEISEINRFHQGKFEEVRVPLHPMGVHYVISQIFRDYFYLDLSTVALDATDYERISIIMSDESIGKGILQYPPERRLSISSMTI